MAALFKSISLTHPYFSQAQNIWCFQVFPFFFDSIARHMYNTVVGYQIKIVIVPELSCSDRKIRPCVDLSTLEKVEPSNISVPPWD